MQHQSTRILIILKMKLRSGKRTLYPEDEPPPKRIKISQDERPILFINDADNTSIIDGMKRVGYDLSVTITKQRDIRPFESEQDLITRIKSVTQNSVNASPNRIIFTKWNEFQSNRIYQCLLKVESLEDLSSDIIKAISDYAIGEIEECMNPNCNQEINILGSDQRLIAPRWYYQDRDIIQCLVMHFIVMIVWII